MSDWHILAKLMILVILYVGLAFAAFFLVERTVDGAMRAIKGALKQEVSTDVGKLNLIGLIGFVFITVFTNLHESLGGLLVKDQSTSLDRTVLGLATVFGMIFLGSLICVAIVERRRKR